MLKKIFIGLVIFFAIVLVGATSLAGYVFWDISTPLSKQEKEVVFRVSEGQNLTEVAQNLHKENLIRSPLIFQMWFKFKNLDNQIKAGIFSLSPTMKMSEIADALISGKTKQVWFTIPEGWTIKQIAEELEKKKIVTAKEFGEALKEKYDYQFLADKPAEAGLEGYLFPDTYKVEVGTSAKEIISKMLANFDQKLSAAMRAEAKRINMSIFEIVTLASIIEKEAPAESDRRLISGVFHNRLKMGMPLESCATLQYSTGIAKRYLSYEETQMDDPYNTYKYQGLPPTPIGNPGLESLRAAVYPKETTYLYFLSDENGNTYFSETYAEHLAKREQYVGE
jgi:UPF0755 protein